MRDPPSTATRRIEASAMILAGSPCSGRGSASRRLLLRAPIVQRAAAERREARAEDHAGIDMIGVGHDPVLERALRLVEHRLHQLTAEPFQLGLVVLDLLALRLALLPDIEALAC